MSTNGACVVSQMNPHFGNNADIQSYRSSKSPSYVERSMSNAFGANPPGMGPEHVFGALRPTRFAKRRLLSGSNTPPGIYAQSLDQDSSLLLL